jgi:2-oxoglutarate dehydrogenase E2 component (dihydrolipoamide succinyltransferase)
MKASVHALKEQPIVNAVIDDGDIVYRDFIDISTAVSTPTGLVVPVIRNCQDMNFHHMEQALNDLAKRARDGSITLEDMAGGTFTITNGGVFGSMMGTPIVNMP